MRVTDPIAACDRLIAVFERAIPLSSKGRWASDDAIRVPILPFAIAQLRMRVRPAFQPDWIVTDPVHITLFGGTNTGKSTVVNLIVGRPAAGMGVRARCSQHPEAYRPAAVGDRWLDGNPTRFQGYRRYRDEHPPRQSDEELHRDGYRRALALLEIDRLPGLPLAPIAAPTAIVWDAPDFSTEQSSSYLGTILDLLALADLVVMTVTDECYADDRGTSLLKMVGDAGVNTLIVANKLPENRTLLDDVGRTLGTAGGSQAPVLRLPEISGTSTLDRLEQLLRCDEADLLRDSVQREAALGSALKQRSLLGSIAFLERHLDEFLGPLTHEVSASASWQATVARLSREAILEPYRRDYLDGIRYGELNRTLLHLMERLQVPLIGPILDLTGRVVRIPLRLAGRGIRSLLGHGSEESKSPPEQEILQDAIPHWLAAIKAEAQVLARSDGREEWTAIVQELESVRFRTALVGPFERAFDVYRERMERLVRRRAEDLYERLSENPKKLATMRGANLMVSATSVALVIKTAGLDWSDAVLGPVVAGVWQNLLEWGLGRYLETLRTELKEAQLQAMRQLVEVHLEQPVRNLFPGAVSAGELDAARADFASIKAEATRIAEGTRS
ncbi:hypothetical protein [Singulisphaera sp. GP187]|uniref:hypothetical protein n=1 Tax=Singulisphaera sp. GP187 TaxID=1882752 RepID=UPI0020B136E1|nr:hypothetical protein [Singulisphaera sp. GP187]